MEVTKSVQDGIVGSTDRLSLNPLGASGCPLGVSGDPLGTSGGCQDFLRGLRTFKGGPKCYLGLFQIS